MGQPACFACRSRPAGNDLGGPYSTYCGDCQPRDTDPPLTGNACLCRACGRVFTAESAFALHQQGRDGGGTVCRDPETAVRHNGEPIFAAYRKLADGTPLWGQYDSRGRRPAPPERVGEGI